jgi:hypothetical protein
VSRFRGQWSVYWGYFGFAVLGLGLAFWQGLVYHDKTTGRIVLAHIQDCQVDPVKGKAVTCTGIWPVGAHAPADVPRTHGTIDGADIPDMYKTVKVHLHGHTAYIQNRTAAPIVFFFVGLLMAVRFIVVAWRKAGPPRSTAATAGLPSG